MCHAPRVLPEDGGFLRLCMRFAACAATQAIIAWTCHLKNHKDDNEEQISPISAADVRPAGG